MAPAPPERSRRIDQVRHSLRGQPRSWLVTGAAGFIGSHPVAELLSLGQRVIGLDDYSSGSVDNIAAAREAAGGSGVIEMIEGDIRDPATCERAVHGADFVLHHAARASVPASIADPATTASINVGGFVNVLEAARIAGVSRLVYASSSAVYGEATSAPIGEATAIAPLSPYAATKASNELFANTYHEVHRFETVGLRYFNIFGPRQDPSGPYAAVIPIWVNALLGGMPCTVFGDGGTSRDFCYVQDVVHANLLAATSTKLANRSSCLNLGRGEETTLAELHGLIRQRIVERRPGTVLPDPLHLPPRRGDIRRSVSDISAARALLEFEPQYTVGDGLDRLIEWVIETDHSAPGSQGADASHRETIRQ
jgi:UDP-N-acetylglucosamine 4-epimerase